MQRARGHLRPFRRASIIAVAFTSMLLTLFAPTASGQAQEAGDNSAPITATEHPPPAADAETSDAASPAPLAVRARPRAREVARAAGSEAERTFRGLWDGFYAKLPKPAVAAATMLLAWLLVRLVRAGLRLASHSWERGSAVAALAGIAIWVVAAGIAVSVIAGDVRGLLGSVGLVGLALSWALQTPIESFTGWLLNSLKGYYRVGDRISVGEVFGDVYSIDLLTTTVWEIGSAERPGAVHAEQPTGRMVTFPNNEILTGTVVNLTKDFPYLWDELAVGVANESDLPYAVEVLSRLARDLLGEEMAEPARAYDKIVRAAGLETAVALEPQVFVSLTDAWTNLTIRYLVSARERRRWKSALILRTAAELGRAEHARRILPGLPRQQVQFVGVDGAPRGAGWFVPDAAPGDPAGTNV